MVRSVQIPEDLYLRLEQLARDRGIASVEALLERLVPGAAIGPDVQRRALVDRIHRQRAQLRAVYGELEDSVDLIRADRER